MLLLLATVLNIAFLVSGPARCGKNTPWVFSSGNLLVDTPGLEGVLQIFYLKLCWKSRDPAARHTLMIVALFR